MSDNDQYLTPEEGSSSADVSLEDKEELEDIELMDDAHLSTNEHAQELSDDPEMNDNLSEEEDEEFSMRLVDLSDPDCQSTITGRTSNPRSIATLVESMRTTGTGGLDLENISDFDLKRRIKDFRLAQTQRRKRYSQSPYGFLGLFVNLSDTRADLHWAEDAAWRRAEHLPYVRWKDYEKARQKGMSRCYFTYTMVLACAVMMVIAFYWNGWEIEPMATNPLIGPKPEVLVLLGAIHMSEMVETGTWYRLVTAVFLHGGIIHIVVNMLALGLLGRAVERNHGFLNTLALFFISAIGGNIVSCLMQPRNILVGSSGGIFGLIGMCVADIVLNWKLLFLVFRNKDGSPPSCWVKLLSMVWLAVDLIANSIIGFTPFVDNFAHLGGLAYGFLISLTVLQRLPLSFFGRGNGVCFKIRIGILRIIGAVLAVALLVTTSILLSESDGLKSPCFKCRYITCIPFPFWTSEKWWYCDGCDAVDATVFKFDDNDKFLFTDLDIYCPGVDAEDGAVQVDISEEGYRDVSDVNDALSDYCRENCF